MLVSNYIESKNHTTLLVVPFKDESVRLHNLISKISQLDLAHQVDVLLVDGGSTDDSVQSQFFLQNRIHTLIEVHSSKGLSEQLRVAFSWALEKGYENVITIDANGKDDPSFVPDIIEELNRGYSFVQASRYRPGGRGVNTPMIRHIAIRYIHVPLLRWASGFAWTDTTQGYRGYSTQVFKDQRVNIFRDVFNQYELLFYLSYRLPRLGYRCTEVPVVRSYPLGKRPTHIKGWRVHMNLMVSLCKVCLGFYNPRKI